MTVQDLIDSNLFKVINKGDNTDTPISKVFCCDLLSVAMGRGIEGAAWVTVMGNINTLAVMSLTDMACIVLAEGAQMDANGLNKAQQQGFTILATDEPIFDAGLKINELINA